MNKYRIMWIVSLFLILIIILIKIIDFKINYEPLKEKKLYFYECNGSLCTTEIKDDTKLLYSKYSCKDETCPQYTANINDDYIILNNNILFNYKTGKEITNAYEEYHFIDDNYIIVKKDNQEGIININNETIVNCKYDMIGIKENNELSGIKYEYIIVSKNNQYGIISYKSGIMKEEMQEENIDKIKKILNEIN